MLILLESLVPGFLQDYVASRGMKQVLKDVSDKLRMEPELMELRVSNATYCSLPPLVSIHHSLNYSHNIRAYLELIANDFLLFIIHISSMCRRFLVDPSRTFFLLVLIDSSHDSPTIYL